MLMQASSGTPPMFGWTDSPSNFSHERHKIPSVCFSQNADMDFRDDENVMFEPEGQNYQKLGPVASWLDAADHG